ncbi:MAG TPA: hypothetical protein DEP84_22965 [Chloroflexi bacterium]|nr:hypothetical protein [Chloroflexota bacterium]
MPPQPLTHRNSAGEVYKRSREVDEQIESALGMSLPHLIERAQKRDHMTSSYLQEKTLVYLIRHYREQENRKAVSALSGILVKRCAKRVNGKLQALPPAMVDEAYQDVIEDLFRAILNLESDEGDFLQVRFWVALDRRTISAYNRKVKEIEADKNLVSLLDLAGEDHDLDDRTNRLAVSTDDLPDPPVSMEQRLLLQDALKTLQEPLRTAFILRYYEGWPIEDSDPDVPTISRHFNRTPRTIRNWLAEAEKILERWRGEPI